MREIDLDPGGYRERKAKGWRWRLPWSHPEDSKLHLALCFVCLGFLVYYWFILSTVSRETAFGAGALFGALAAAQLMLALRD